MDAARKGRPSLPPTGGVKIKIDSDAQGLINFGKAVKELVRLGALDRHLADAMKLVYEMSSKEGQTALWDEVHPKFEEYGYHYRTAGWTD
jgi:hypothetical protein